LGGRFGRLVTILILTLAISSASGCGRAEVQAPGDPAPQSKPARAFRSCVVSDVATPEEVARAYVLALSENRPEDANALWTSEAAPLLISGPEAWRGQTDLVIAKSRPATGFPASAQVPADVQAAEAEIVAKYTTLATVNGSMVLHSEDEEFQRGTLEFVVRLGRGSDGEWDVLGVRFEQ